MVRIGLLPGEGGSFLSGKRRVLCFCNCIYSTICCNLWFTVSIPTANTTIKNYFRCAIISRWVIPHQLNKGVTPRLEKVCEIWHSDRCNSKYTESKFSSKRFLTNSKLWGLEVAKTTPYCYETSPSVCRLFAQGAKNFQRHGILSIVLVIAYSYILFQPMWSELPVELRAVSDKWLINYKSTEPVVINYSVICCYFVTYDYYIDNRLCNRPNEPGQTVSVPAI